MDTRLGVAHRESVPEQRRALRLVQALLGGDAEEVTLRSGLGHSRLREGKDEHVLGENALLLDTRRGEVNELADVSSAPNDTADTHPLRIEIPPPVPVTQPSL